MKYLLHRTFIKYGCFFCLLLSFSLPSLKVAAADIPELGSYSGSVLSPQQEAEIGKRLLRFFRRRKKIVDDPLIDHYINSLGYKLVAQSEQPSRQFTFFIVKDRSINAFAAPGGYIGVHLGLIEIATTESELAAVLAHEVAHITQNHLARMFASSKRRGLAMTAALIAALVASKSSPQLRSGAVMTTLAANQQSSLNFTRSNELEADHIGIKILVDAGFDPEAMPRFFQRMQKSSRLHGVKLPEFLRTHPVDDTRIADAKNRVSQYSRKPKPDSINYLLMRYRLNVLLGQNASLIARHFQKRLKSGYSLNKDAVRYGLALSLARSGKHQQARNHINKLLKKDPARLAYLIAAGEIEQSAKNLKKVNDLFGDALALYPNNYTVIYYYSNALMQLNQPKQAYKIMHKYIANRENKINAPLHNAYSHAAAKTGKLDEAYYHRAEYFYLTGHLKLALDQFKKAAHNNKNDEILEAKIVTRISTVKSEIALAKKKKK